MGQKSTDGGKNEPSLELPSLKLPGLGRKKKARPAKAPADAATDGPAEEPVEESAAQVAAMPEDEEPATRIPVQQPVAEPEAEPTAPLFVDEALGHQTADESTGQTEPDEGAPSAPKGDIAFSLLPHVPGRVAAIITGLVVGVFGTALTYASLRGCEAVRGTQSCGGPGFFALVAILIVMIMLGMVLLRAWQVSDPGSTSFLAVGLVCVVVLVTLLKVIFSAWMFLIVPLISAAAYALSHWVTTRFVEPVDSAR